MRFLFLFVFIVSCGGNVFEVKSEPQEAVEYAVESSYSVEEEGHIIIKLSDSQFDIGHENVLGYDYKNDQCIFSLNYEEELHPVIFFNDLCNGMVDNFCIIKDGFGLVVECNPIGVLPESMRGKLNKTKKEIFENQEVQNLVSCFRSMVLFDDGSDISQCEKGVF